MAMKVWRVENREGEGPYCAGVVSANLDGLGYDYERCPGPVIDIGPWHEWNTGLFAFPSMEAAVEWWTVEGLEKLAELGFPLVEREAERVLVSRSGKQCVFWPCSREERAA